MIATGWTLRRTGSLVERNALIYRRSLTPALSAILEPILYLLSIGFGVGALVGKVHGVDVPYAAFVAPAILATTAMNAAFNQTSFGIFLRIKNDRIYDAIVPTPLSIADIAIGEVASAVLSGLLPGSIRPWAIEPFMPLRSKALRPENCATWSVKCPGQLAMLLRPEFSLTTSLSGALG